MVLHTIPMHMPFKRTKPPLKINRKDRKKLRVLSRSRTVPHATVLRAKILLGHRQGHPTLSLSRNLHVSRSTVNRCVDKALQFGINVALKDLPRSGRPATITQEAITWLLSLACAKPKDFGHPHELWTIRLLTEHIRQRCRKANHPSLLRIAPGTVCKILSQNKIKPHKIKYYIQKRDPDFETKMTKVIKEYRRVERIKKHPAKSKKNNKTVWLSYDEKPGIQAIQNIAPDLNPAPGKHSTFARDPEYKRLGTISLLAGLNLVTGKIYHLVADRHRSREFVQFLKNLIASHPATTTFRIILDNHSAHISKETRAFLKTVPNRFHFIFTPVHGSWLNLVESFFAKMAKSVLRHIRVDSKAELIRRIKLYLNRNNADPVVFAWKSLLKTAA